MRMLMENEHLVELKGFCDMVQLSVVKLVPGTFSGEVILSITMSVSEAKLLSRAFMLEAEHAGGRSEE